MYKLPLLLIPILIGSASTAWAVPTVVRSVQSGRWSVAATWSSGNVPKKGEIVQVREGHRVVYDVVSDSVIRSLHIAGTLTFATDVDTRLDVGLIKIQPGDDISEDGFDCEAHMPEMDESEVRPALEVGTPGQPVSAAHTALIRLVYIDGMDKQSCPALVCCGGRMDLHGAPLSRTWLKLDAPAESGATTIVLAESVTGWRTGDRVLLTATTRQNKINKTFREHVTDSTQTEERTITKIDGEKLTLDHPLEFTHVAEGDYRGDVANLSRNVIVESATPDGERGHTMYHRGSAGAISNAEFRHLGKPGVLGRYSIHFHLVGDTMRGSSVIGASIHHSGNRWITIHGTNYLVVRDCVGYRSLGHGFFLEDGTEVNNVLDRNLAVQALTTKPLPKQVLPYDLNDGSGFWWANSLNSFTRNVAADCDEYGYFFQVIKNDEFNPQLDVRQSDGTPQPIDIRTLPFLRFDDNEAHCQRRHSINLGGSAPFGPGVAGIGPDEHHPFVLRNTRLWNVHWAFHPVSPSVMVDQMDIYNAEYSVWRPVYDRHAYRGIHTTAITVQKGFDFMPVGKRPREENFPKPLAPIDDLPPATVITHLLKSAVGEVTIRGVTMDNGDIRRVTVNGLEARPTEKNFAQWEVTMELPTGVEKIVATAEDAAGNVEKTSAVVKRN